MAASLSPHAFDKRRPLVRGANESDYCISRRKEESRLQSFAQTASALTKHVTFLRMSLKPSFAIITLLFLLSSFPVSHFDLQQMPFPPPPPTARIIPHPFLLYSTSLFHPRPAARSPAYSSRKKLINMRVSSDSLHDWGRDGRRGTLGWGGRKRKESDMRQKPWIKPLICTRAEKDIPRIYLPHCSKVATVTGRWFRNNNNVDVGIVIIRCSSGCS